MGGDVVCGFALATGWDVAVLCAVSNRGWIVWSTGNLASCRSYRLLRSMS